MQIIRNFNNIPANFVKGAVLTIGDFDGVHIGHQKLLNITLSRASVLNIFSVALIFEPQPSEYFADGDRPFRLTSLKDKLKILEEINIDYTIIDRLAGWDELQRFLPPTSLIY